MTPERWSQIERIYHAALERDERQRSLYLQETCKSDEELRKEVESLLARAERAEPFIELPALELAAKSLAAEPTDSLLGKLLGAYEILKPLGSGGMGVVYQGRDSRLDRLAAIKVLSPGVEDDQRRMRRFLLEAKAASALNHPNVATIYEIGESDSGRFIAMEYVDGQTLAARIKSSPLGVGQIVEIGIQIADALDEAHSKGIIHRDVKPANIMLTVRGQVKVLDFGLAKIAACEGRTFLGGSGAETATVPGLVLGTVQYMSPEQVLGHDLDQRTDLFSLGVMLYEMATGRPPFAGVTATETMDQVLHQEPEAITRLNPRVPLELEHIVNKALEKDRKARYPSAKDLLADLTRLRENLHTEQAPPTAKAVKPRRLKKMTTRIAVSAVASILVLAAAAVWNSRQEPVLSFAERDWVLVTDAENLTGDSVFDKSLSTALAISLEQSTYASVYSRSRVIETLKRMKKPDNTRIDETVGREIALREGIRAVITPGISGIGETYRLVSRIRDPLTGRDVKTESVRANGKDKVLDAMDQLAQKIRQNLGESLPAISRSNKPLAEATTASLEALQVFSTGQEKIRESKFDEAKPFYESALQIDPHFTAARASLGILHVEQSARSNKFDREEGKRLLTEAIKDVDQLTDKERHGILAFHARAVEQDAEKSVRIQKALLILYPNFSYGHNNLAYTFTQMGRYPAAVAEYKEAVRLDPRLMLAYNGLNFLYLLRLGEVNSAIENCKQQLANNDQHAEAYSWMGLALLGAGDLKQAEVTLKQALELDPTFITNRYRLGHIYRLEQRYKDAAEIFAGILETDPGECMARYNQGIISETMGKKQAARASFQASRTCMERQLRRNPRAAIWHVNVALASLRLREKSKAQNAERKALALNPKLTFESALLLCLGGSSEEAVQRLEQAVDEGFRDYIWMKIHPDLQSLYNHPRFVALVQRGLAGRKE